jgi:hypothetical protein
MAVQFETQDRRRPSDAQTLHSEDPGDRGWVRQSIACQGACPAEPYASPEPDANDLSAAIVLAVQADAPALGLFFRTHRATLANTLDDIVHRATGMAVSGHKRAARPSQGANNA